jgi:hypothetical protein
MGRQLHLAVDTESGNADRFRIDARTKAIGRKGLAKARAALARGRSGVAGDTTEHDAPPAAKSTGRSRRKAA